MRTIEAGIVIIGGGPAGLSAAWEAGSRGVRTLVLEKTDRPGGVSGGGIGMFAVDSSIQKKMLIKFSVEDAFRLVTDYTHNKADARLLSDIWAARSIPARLIINRLRPRKIMDGSMPDIDRIIDESALQLMGVIPEDETVAVANANGRPLPLDCNAALCFSNIARRFVGETVLLAPLEKM